MRTLRTKPSFKLYYRYKNIILWKNKTIKNLTHKKWNTLQNVNIRQMNKGIYLCHYKKLNIVKLYYYKFINKQLLKKYFINYKDSNFRKYFLTKFITFEKRLDFNLYQAKFVPSLYAARFYITKGYILVNKKPIYHVNYILKRNDLVEICPKIFNNLKLNNSLFNKNNSLVYIRNIEIDYKTFSFIFLDNKKYYILNFDNFIKKIYFYNSKRTVTLLNDTNKRIYNLRNLANINNYFKFFEYIFNYYLFLDKYNKILNKRKFKNLTNYNVFLLLKYIRFYYNDYFFRNILLKRIYNLKYNYLYLLFSNNLFNNYFIFENISKLFSETRLINNKTLKTEFFKYYYNIFFNFFIYLKKNYYINNLIFNLEITSINNYNLILFLNKKIFQLIHIKNKLYNYYKISYSLNSYDNILGTNKYKLINTTAIPSYLNSKQTIHYMYSFRFSNLLTYISSTKFKYRIYRKCHSFKHNNSKRYYLIIRLRKSLSYKYYNCIKLYNPKSLYTKRFIFNALIHKTKNIEFCKKNNKKILNYYPKNSKIYNKLYNNLSISLFENKTNIKRNIDKIFVLYSKLQKSSTETKALFLNLSKLKIDLQLKYKYFTANRSYINYNYNSNYKNLYLLNNLINLKVKNKNNDYFTLTKSNYNILYKIHICNNYLNTRYNEHFSTKHYHRFMNYYNQRYKLNYFYLNCSKPRTYLAFNLNKFNQIFYRKINDSYFLNLYNNFRKNRSKYFYKRDYNLGILNNIKHYKSNNLYLLNMNIIDSKYNFKDNLFYIDLLLNMSIRKLNENYNFCNYTFFNKFTNLTSKKNKTYLSLVTTSSINKFNETMKKGNFNKTYFYKHYNLKYTNYYKFTTKITNFKFLINYQLHSLLKNKTTNMFIFYYNLNLYNMLYFKKFNKIYLNFKNKKLNKLNYLLFNNFKRQNYLNYIYKLYTYYIFNIRKYNIIKYIYTNYIFKEYLVFINNILTVKNTKILNKTYIQQLYYNLLFSKIYNNDKFNFVLQNNYLYSRNLRIIINYFILIKRLYH